MSDRWQCIATGRAGRRARRMLDAAQHALGAHGVAGGIVATEYAGHAEQLAREAAEGGCKGIAVIGGDGTIHEVVNGIAGFPEVRIGILPCGRGNDAARALGIPRTPEMAARVLVEGAEVVVDTGLVGERRFLTVACVGIDARIATAALAGSGRFRGRLSYAAGFVREALRLRSVPIEIVGDFDALSGPRLLVAVCNTSSYGGGLRIGPGADPRDGCFDICVVGPLKRRRLLACLPAAIRGEHAGLDEVSTYRSRFVEIRSNQTLAVVADGEVCGTTPVKIEVQPSSLRVMVPKEGATDP